MKKSNLFVQVALSICFIAVLCSCNNCSKNDKSKIAKNNITFVDTADATNNFYDNAETKELPMTPVTIAGEVENPGTVDFSALPLHTVIVKESALSGDSNKFIGAYRYDGYSLYDILNLIKVKKANKKEFDSKIDTYVQIENAKGEMVNISWGEFYYPNHLHEIIIAKSVMRIVPSKTKDLWPLPDACKLIVSSDLLTERNISAPSKITVISYPKSFKTVRGMKPIFSPVIKLYSENNLLDSFTKNPKNIIEQTYPAIFYGRGRGIHSTEPFTGVMMKEVLAKYFKITQENLRKGMFLVVAKDGYRAVFTFSELMNRNDQQEVLLICHPEVNDNGIFKVFPACDFFSDRAIKGISAVYFSDSSK